MINTLFKFLLSPKTFT